MIYLACQYVNSNYCSRSLIEGGDPVKSCGVILGILSTGCYNKDDDKVTESYKYTDDDGDEDAINGATYFRDSKHSGTMCGKAEGV